MLLLALDTSGPSVTVALHDGAGPLAAAHDPGSRRHAEALAPAIERVLVGTGRPRADVLARLTHLVVGVGPGPFTGLRVGVVTARVLGAALDLPVVGVCSLDALAERAPAGAPAFVVATDARRHEVHWARYERDAQGHPVRRDGPYVARPPEVPVAGLPVVGRGAALYPQILGDPVPDVPLDVDAVDVARVAVRALAAGPVTGGPAADGPVTGGPAGAGVLLGPEPLYLRRPDATVPGERKRVLR